VRSQLTVLTAGVWSTFYSHVTAATPRRRRRRLRLRSSYNVKTHLSIIVNYSLIQRIRVNNWFLAKRPTAGCCHTKVSCDSCSCLRVRLLRKTHTNQHLTDTADQTNTLLCAASTDTVTHIIA